MSCEPSSGRPASLGVESGDGFRRFPVTTMRRSCTQVTIVIIVDAAIPIILCSVRNGGGGLPPIGFGEGTNRQAQSRIAAETAGGLFSADPTSIDNGYISIPAEQ